MEKKEVKKQEFLNFERAIALLLILSLFVILKTAFTTPKTPSPVEEANIVLYTLTDGNSKMSLLDSNSVEEEKIRNLNQMDYGEIKNMLGVKTNFCIFFEDASGNLIKIDGIGSGVGSDKIYINGEPCK